MAAPTSNDLIDTVDDLDQPIGKVRRGEALALGANFRTSHVFVWTTDHKLLVQELAADRERHGGRWGSSVAAYLFAGETYEQAAKRRMAEEVGVDAPLTAVLKVEMRDEESRKFVSLFEAETSEWQNTEPNHIAALREATIESLWNDVDVNPAEYTPTFRLLLERYREQRSGRAAPA